MTRRDLLSHAAAMATMTLPAAAQNSPKPRPGRLKQGVCGGVLGRGFDLEQRCRVAADLGATGHDLVGPKDFPILKKYGLAPTMVPGIGTLMHNSTDLSRHNELEAQAIDVIKAAAEAKAPNAILLSGNKWGQSVERCLDNNEKFVRRIIKRAEDAGVTLCMELLNSKVNHPDYACDHTAYGLELCKRIGSPRFKLLYDIYHMQIMEGDIIRTIEQNIQFFGHFHTAGNPGRYEFDLETQEMNYGPIMKKIADLGFQGWVSHEYSPRPGNPDPVKTLDRMLKMCEV
ncbi:MAG: TIM barrel protein [bacterium]|jgi:hydroxypyruvate isomerase